MSLIKLANEFDRGVAPTERQRSVDSYYDHVPSSAAFGTAVGAGMGVPTGLMTGVGINRLNTALKASRTVPHIRKRTNFLGKITGHTSRDLDDLVRRLPTAKKVLGTTTAAGAGLGAVDGAYRGAMTGVGMNDRQYLLGEDISNDNLVYNSRVSAVKMNSNGGRIGNLYNDRFGKHTGSMRRMFNEERKDRAVRE